ncbi:hypothetical protein ACQEUX_12010 [Micromonospora sp. CA-259024]|uniref:hypothetical protein n=1 Tax=Micromonospora sp. CA-259024 TaxID=3239965 RepID=UPI003D936D19
MVRRRAATLLASLTLATGTLLAVGVTPASAAGSCSEWWDANTYGVTCSGYASGAQVRATARCANETLATGQWKNAATGGWSYAYCAGRGGLHASGSMAPDFR